VLVEACRALDVPVLASEQYPQGLGPTVESLATLLGDTPPAKLTFSCSRDEGLREAIEKSGRQQVVVTGIEAHVCVLQTVLDLLNNEYEVFVPYDAVNSRRKSDRKWALRRMASAGAVITTTESALFELVERCDTADFKTVAKLIKKIPV
jgi:isochorismate hydrolase